MSYIYDYENPTDGAVPSTVLYELYSAIVERDNMWGLQSRLNTTLIEHFHKIDDFINPRDGLNRIYRGIISLSSKYKDNSYESSAPDLDSDINLDETFFKYKTYQMSKNIIDSCSNTELYDKFEAVIGFEPVFMKTFNANDPLDVIGFNFKNPHELGGVLLSTDILFEIYEIINKCFTHCLYFADWQNNRFRSSAIRKDNTFRTKYVGQDVFLIDPDHTIYYGDGTRKAWGADGFATENTSSLALDSSFIEATNDIVLTSTNQSTVIPTVDIDHVANEDGGNFNGVYDILYTSALEVVKPTKNSSGVHIENNDIECWQMWTNTRLAILRPYPDMGGTENIPPNPNVFHLMSGVYKIVDGYNTWSFIYKDLDQIPTSDWSRAFGSDYKNYHGDLWTMVCSININKPEVIKYYTEDTN